MAVAVRVLVTPARLMQWLKGQKRS